MKPNLRTVYSPFFTSIRALVMWLVVGGGFMAMAHQAVATTTNKDVAMTLFDQSIGHCNEATRASRSDPGSAKQAFDNYLSTYKRALAIYPELANSDVGIFRKVEQCRQIGENVARAQALPLLKQGIEACEASKDLIKGDYLTKARARYKEYKSLRDRAVAYTDSVLKVASNSSKVRRCDKLEERIVKAQSRIKMEENSASLLISVLQRSEDTCKVAQRMAVKSGENRSNLDATVSMFGHAERYFEEARTYPKALERAQNYPGYESSKKIRKITEQYVFCHDELVAHINAATQSVVQQEELAKLREQQKIEKAVAIAVAKARKEKNNDEIKGQERPHVTEKQGVVSNSRERLEEEPTDSNVAQNTKAW